MTVTTKLPPVAKFAKDNPHLSFSEIGEEFGISRQRAHQIVTKHGVKKLPRPSLQRPDVTVEEVFKLYSAEGLTIEGVAARLDCGLTTVKRRLDRAGYKFRHHNRGNRTYRRRGNGTQIKD